MTAINVNGHATINGVDTRRVGLAIADLVDRGDCEELGETEMQIATQVARRVVRMRDKGYSPKDVAAFAHRLVVQMAAAVN